MSVKHREQANKQTALYPAQSIMEWKAVIKAWEADHTKTDPYAEPEYSKSQTLTFIL